MVRDSTFLRYSLQLTSDPVFCHKLSIRRNYAVGVLLFLRSLDSSVCAHCLDITGDREEKSFLDEWDVGLLRCDYKLREM